MNRDHFFQIVKSDAPSGAKTPGGALLQWSIVEGKYTGSALQSSSFPLGVADPGEPPDETLVTVEIEPVGNESKLVLTRVRG